MIAQFDRWGVGSDISYITRYTIYTTPDIWNFTTQRTSCGYEVSNYAIYRAALSKVTRRRVGRQHISVSDNTWPHAKHPSLSIAFSRFLESTLPDCVSWAWLKANRKYTNKVDFYYAVFVRSIHSIVCLMMVDISWLKQSTRYCGVNIESASYS